MGLPITRVFPAPRPVTLGGRDYFAQELRLGDLARIRAVRERTTPDPLRSIRGGRGDRGRFAWRDAMDAALAGAERWPEPPGMPDAATMLEEAAEFVRACLIRDRPGLSDEEAVRVAVEMAEADWEALRAVAYGRTPMDELLEIVDGPGGPKREKWDRDDPDWLPEWDDEDDGDEEDWGHSVFALIADGRIKGFPEAMALTVTQYRLLCGRGELHKAGKAPPPGVPHAEVSRRQKRKFYALRDDEPDFPPRNRASGPAEEQWADERDADPEAAGRG